MTKECIGANMMLISSVWNDRDTFRMIPVNQNCPYIEAIYDRQFNALAIVSKLKKTNMHMLPKLDEQGDPIKVKTPRASGKPYKEERRAVDTYQEFYVINKEEIESIVKKFAINADSFDYAKFMVEEKEPAIMPIEKPNIVIAKK
jgi:hypothetical protein